MGIGDSFGIAFLKSQMGGGYDVPTSGNIFISVKGKYNERVAPLAKQLTDMGFTVFASPETHKTLSAQKIKSTELQLESGSPNVLDYIKEGKLKLIINVLAGKVSINDEMNIRQQALIQNIPVITTLPCAAATVNAMIETISRKLEVSVKPLQELYELS